MKPILLVRNDAMETFGVAMDAFGDARASILTWDAIGGGERPDLDRVSAVVMFGSSHNVDEIERYPFLRTIRELTKDAVDRGLPYLGICLGAQVLARAMGTSVTQAPVREIGFEPIMMTEASKDDRLLGHYASGDRVFQWHKDTFQLPEGGVVLATGEHVALEACRLDEIAWATQFHFEIDADEIDSWLESEDASGLERDWGKSPATIRAEAQRDLAAHQVKGHEVFRRFAEVAKDPGR
ncbi:MAG: type 1 glutamine amidotransferase [Actinomycetota bacterium]